MYQRCIDIPLYFTDFNAITASSSPKTDVNKSKLYIVFANFTTTTSVPYPKNDVSKPKLCMVFANLATVLVDHPWHLCQCSTCGATRQTLPSRNSKEHS